MDMTQDLVYTLVASNPSLRNLVEQTAKLYQLQQQAQQMTPMLQQMAQNPLGAANNFTNWQQQAQGQQPQPQPTPAPTPEQNQQGGQAVGMLDQAMGIVEEFKKSLEIINKNQKEIYDMCAANAEAIKVLTDKFDADSKPAVKGKRNSEEG